MRRAALVLVAGLAWGCSTVPDDELLASAALIRELDRESADVIEVARFSQRKAGPLPDVWQPWIVLPSKPRTQYRLVESDSGVVLQADAERAASGTYRRIRIDPARHPILEWRWRVPRLIDGADPRHAGAEDSPARLVVSFHGDEEKLGMEDRVKLRLAKALSGQPLPYATLMYIWSNDLAPGTVVHNPHTGRIRMLVVESGASATGSWRSVRRNVLEDYRRAFGEDPWDIVAIGVMTDSDNTASRAQGFYGDITMRRGE